MEAACGPRKIARYAALRHLEAGAHEDPEVPPSTGSAAPGGPLGDGGAPRRPLLSCRCLSVASTCGAVAAVTTLGVAWWGPARTTRALSTRSASDAVSHVVSHAIAIHQLTQAGKGCSNWVDIAIEDLLHNSDVDSCMERCAGDDSCIGFNFQSGDPVECKDGDGKKGTCMPVSKSCEFEENACWDFYEKASPVLSQPPVNQSEAHARMAESPRPVQRECAVPGEGCWQARCCKDPEETCFAKDLGWAQCLKTCSSEDRPNEVEDVQTNWLCVPVLFERDDYDKESPGNDLAPHDEKSVALPWFATSDCAAEGEYCLDKACCSSRMTCFEKHPLFAACKPKCKPGIDESEAREEQTPWSCKEVQLGSSDSLFCFALMVPDSYEVRLLEAQMGARAGIFACDASMVYSNRSVTLTPSSNGSSARSIETQVVNTSLHCDLGGVYMTALNTEIFVRVWKKVMAGHEYASHDWTVKVDPDAVFLPSRLKQHVTNYQYLQGRQRSVFLNNCKDGLHGPIEVLSHGAMQVFKRGIDTCVDRFKTEYTEFGEDVFLRHCLAHLAVSRIDDLGLLKETHCDPFPGEPEPCNMGRVAFHPLKTPDSWLECLAQASEEEPEEEDEEESKGNQPATTTYAPSTTTEVMETCQQYGGIPHFDQVTCCSPSCGKHCGAPDCADYGRDQCCGGGIKDSLACSDTQPAPCTMRKMLLHIKDTKKAEKKKLDALKQLKWECVDYNALEVTNESAGADWCKSAGVQHGVEYMFFGKDSPCDSCWCCQRSLDQGAAAPAESRPEAAVEGKATQETTDQNYLVMGQGFCVDSVGQEYRQYWSYDRLPGVPPLDDCTNICNVVPQCLGFTLQTSTQRCAIHTAGEEPVWGSGSWDATYRDGFAGLGDIQGASGGDDAECYKRPWGVPPVAVETN